MLVYTFCKIIIFEMEYEYYEESSHADVYNLFRPSTPKELVEIIIKYLQEEISECSLAVDVGCGSGQSTESLAGYFDRVIGFDPCDKQIRNAELKNNLTNVVYRVGNAEKIECLDDSVQLITAGQCSHWFDLPKFYEEAARVLVPGGVLAMYGYLLPRPQYGDKSLLLCDIIDKYYNDVLAKYVLPESRKVYIDNYKGREFTDIPFIKTPVIRDESVKTVYKATVTDLVGYAKSWSAFQNCIKQEGEDKASEIIECLERDIMDVIGSKDSAKDVNINIEYHYFILMARKPVK